MDDPALVIDRVSALTPISASELPPRLQVFRGVYRRTIPPHYQNNPHIRETIEVNLLLAERAVLVMPATPRTTFHEFYRELAGANPALFHQILSPIGAAKAVSAGHPTPIKQITQLQLANLTLPGDAEQYGWGALAAEGLRRGARLELMFQGNGLYFNRGSVMFDGAELSDFPNASLAGFLYNGANAELLEMLAAPEAGLKRPLLFFVSEEDRRMTAYLHEFQPDETYREGMARLRQTLRARRVQAAFAASPPLILPGADLQPCYLTPAEVLGRFHANDVRHYLYCPYEGSVLLSAELGRVQCLEPARLAAALSGLDADRLRLPLRETLRFVSPAQLEAILIKKGYARHFSMVEDAQAMRIAPLEGVYSHLLPCLTRQGRFGILQTSGTHGNITGNDGPTLRQLSGILRDLNAQPLFAHDPIIAAASGCQGNDVPNVICRSRSGGPQLLSALAPQLALDEHPGPRGVVTTPRMGIACLNRG